MTEKVLAALDAITARVLSYRPKDKGLAAKKTAALCSKRTKAVSNVITGDGDCQRFTCAAPLEEWAL